MIRWEEQSDGNWLGAHLGGRVQNEPTLGHADLLAAPTDQDLLGLAVALTRRSDDRGRDR